MTAAKKAPAKKSEPARTAAAAISRMPRALRDQVSQALVDGADWRKVSKMCAAAGHPGVNAQNVTNYRQGAHKEWLARQERMEAIRRDSEATAEIMRHYQANGGSPAEAGLLAASEILSGALRGMGPETIQILLADDPKSLFAVTRELARIADLVGQRREQEKQTTAAPQGESEGGNKLSEEEQRRRVLDMVDQALGLKK